MYNTFKPEQPVGLMDFVRAAKSCIKEIPPRALLDKLKTEEDLMLIDVREHGEYEAGPIKGAHLVPPGLIEAAGDPAYPKHLPELAAARDRQVIVYCASNGRSAMTAAVLQMMGFKNVLNMEGGYARWVADGMPQENEVSY
jgi:rhodanese-related sulfurtransferase